MPPSRPKHESQASYWITTIVVALVILGVARTYLIPDDRIDDFALRAILTVASFVLAIYVGRSVGRLVANRRNR